MKKEKVVIKTLKNIKCSIQNVVSHYPPVEPIGMMTVFPKPKETFLMAYLI